MTNVIKKIAQISGGFRFRLIALVLAGIFIVSIAYYFYSIKNQRDLFNKSFQKSTENTLETVKIGIEVGLSLENYETINTIFTWIKSDSVVKFIALSDETGIFASYPDNKSFKLSELNSLVASAETSSQIIVKSIDWKSQFGNGKIFMGFSTEALINFEHKTFIELGGLSLIFIFSAVVIVLFLSLGITKPLHNLKNASDEIRNGNFDARADETKGGNEIQSVAQAFNMMVKELTDTQNRLENDLNKAADFVEQLLPYPIKSPIEIDWLFQPSDVLGGDAFGYHFLDDNSFAVYLIDVSGHGVGPALYSVSVLNIIKEESLANTDFHNPSDLMNSLNRIFQMNKYDNKYFTIWYGVFDLKKKILKYSSAGHPPAILLKPNEDTMELDAGNIFIGAFPDTDYKDEEIAVDAGQTIYIFSDGLVEFMKKDNTVFSMAEFKTTLEEFNKKNDTLDDLLLVLENLKMKQNLQDDISLLRLRI